MPEEKRSWTTSVLIACVKEIIAHRLSLIKKTLKHYLVSFVIVFASIIVVFYGIGSLVGSLFPELPPGTSHIIVGIVFILIAWAYAKSS